MYEEFQKHIQPLIDLMAKHYPHDFQLTINSFSATIESTHPYLCFTSKDFMDNYCCISDEEAKDILQNAISHIPSTPK